MRISKSYTAASCGSGKTYTASMGSFEELTYLCETVAEATNPRTSNATSVCVSATGSNSPVVAERYKRHPSSACGVPPSDCAAAAELSDCAGLATLAKNVMSKSARAIGSQVIGIQSMGRPGTD